MSSAATLDHLVFGARTLEQGVAAIEAALGMRPVAGGRHPAWGTHNALLGLEGDRYIEVLAPDPDGPPPRAAPLGLEALATPRLVTWAARTRDLEAHVARLRALGVDPGAVREGGRITPDGTRLAWRLTDLAAPRLGGVVPFLIDWGDSPHPSRGLPVAGALQRLVLRHPEPTRVRAALEAIGIEVPIEAAPAPGLAVTIRTPRGDVTLD